MQTEVIARSKVTDSILCHTVINTGTRLKQRSVCVETRVGKLVCKNKLKHIFNEDYKQRSACIYTRVGKLTC